MPVTDSRVDAYINKAAPFAKPILQKIRQIIHAACPEATETIKWGFPHFEYNGSNLCSMASFKQHAAFTFWLASLMKDAHHIFNKDPGNAAMGNLGQLKSLEDLPSTTILTKYVYEAMDLIKKGTKLSKKTSQVPPSKTVEIPDYLITALKTSKAAFENFESFPYSHKKEYVEWITEAKTEATRRKRLATAVEWIGEGKNRNWKYEKNPNK